MSNPRGRQSLQNQSKQERRSPKSKQPRKMWHLFIISTFSLAFVYQLVMSRAQLIDLHYQIETIEYQIGKIETEKNAYYQHQAELTKLSRLKESISSEDVRLEGDRIYRLAQ